MSVVGWLVALAALGGYWYYYGRQPAPGPGDEVAEITALVGEVKHRPLAQEAWAAAQLAERLRVGDEVQTEPRGAAEISFDAGSVVRVRSSSVVHIGDSAESSTAAWRVRAGHINFSVGTETTEIVTPTARTTAESFSVGDIDVTDTGATGIKVFRGRANVQTSLDQRITLSENEAVQVDAAGKAGAKLALPPPPELVAPAPRAEIPANAAARLSWTAVEGGASYRLALDYNVTQANLLLAAALDEPGITGTARELLGLDPGRYFWRVAAVNAEGFEGAFSRTSLFAVVPPIRAAPPSPTPPQLVIEALDEVAPGIFRLAGRTDPRATVTVNGVALRLSPDGTFTEYVQRGRARELLVRSTIQGGATSERSRPFGR